MDLRGAVVGLVDGDGGVHDLGLDGLLVDDRLDGLVDVMVDVLTGGNAGVGLCVVCLGGGGGVPKLGCFTRKTLFCLALILVVELAMLNWDHVVGVLLGEDLLVSQRLHGCVKMVLVDLTVNGLCDVFMTSGLDGLGGDGRVDPLLDVGVVAMLAGELVDGGFGGLHYGNVIGGLVCLAFVVYRGRIDACQ